MGKRDYAAERAHRRNVEKAQQRARQAKWEQFKKTKGKKTLILSIIIAVVLIVGITGAVHMHKYGGLIGKTENSIIANFGTNSSPVYKNLGVMTVPEGFTLETDYTGYGSSSKAQSRFYDAEDQTATVTGLYVSGNSKTAQENVDKVVEASYYTTCSEPKEVEIGGQKAIALYMYYEASDEDDDTTTTTSTDTEEVTEPVRGNCILGLYMDAQGGGISMMLQSSEADYADVPDEETMLAQAEIYLPLLKVNK